MNVVVGDGKNGVFYQQQQYNSKKDFEEYVQYVI